MYLVWSVGTAELLDSLDLNVDQCLLLMTPIIINNIPKNRIENPEPSTIAMIAPVLSVFSTVVWISL